MARASSVRPAPTRPARPRISPLRTSRLMSWSMTACGSRASRARETPSTARATAPPPRALAVGEQAVDLAADHQADDALDVELGDGGGAGQRAVAQHGGAVADPQHLLEPVGDEDDRDALGLEPAHDGEQALDLLVGQGRGRLVHDHELGRPSTGRGRSRPSAARRPRGRRPGGAGRRRGRPRRSAPWCGDAARAQSTRPSRTGRRPMNTFSATESVGIRLNSW